MRAVFLDSASLGNDVDLSPMRAAVDELALWPTTTPEEIQQRLDGFEIAIVNKVVLGEEHFAAHPELRLVAVSATGVNNVDLEAAARHGIRVVNVIGYGRGSIVQHTYSLMFALAGRLLDYVRDVRNGEWQKSSLFCLMDHPIVELEGKTLGVIGYGELGKGVANLARALGMNVLLGARPGQAPGTKDGLPRLPLDELLPQVDVLSLHCLLSEETRNMIGRQELATMKPTAFLINTARGGIVDEEALADALRNGRLGGAGIDVLTEEPPVHGNPLLADDIPNLIVTPHCAWASHEARQRMVNLCAQNLREFVEGKLTRWVV